MKKSILFVFLALAFLSCKTGLPEAGSQEYNSSIRDFYVGLAALQVGFDQKAIEKLKSASETAAGEPAVWNNLGVLQLRQRDYENAGKSFETASSLAPENAEIYFNRAVLAQQAGEPDKASEFLAKVLEADPKNLQAHFVLATEAEKQAKDADALKSFDEILKIEPENLAALIESARLRAKLDEKKGLDEAIRKIGAKKNEWPVEAREQFEKLSGASSQQTGAELAFLRNVLIRVPEFRASLDKIKPSDTILGNVITRPLLMKAPDFSPAEPDLEITFKTEPVSAEKVSTSAILYADGTKAPAVIASGPDGTIAGNSKFPLSAAAPHGIAAFDFDYDYKNDVAIAGESGFGLFKQTAEGAFEDVTSKSGNDAVAGGSYNGVWPFDFDNEGDLDLLLAESSKIPVVLRNKGDGTFETLRPFAEVSDISDFEYADLDEDGDSDAVFLNGDGVVVLYTNERGGLFKKSGEFSVKEAAAITIGDTNGDGALDLIVLLRSGGVVRTKSMSPSIASPEAEVFDIKPVKCEPACLIQTADIDNNGANDIVVSDTAISHILLGGKDGKFTGAQNAVEAFVTGIADFNKDGRLDFSAVGKNGESQRFINNSSRKYHWQVLQPKAAKTSGDQRINTFGIGGEIEIRSGLAAQKQLIRSPFVHFGLGNSSSADVARVVWQNGYVQAEFDLKADQTIAAEQRLKGSCPHLFAWNGKEFAHVKDAPPWSPALGLKINAQDTYGILQTEEWFKIPGEALAEKDGFYELRITGEYWEAYYIDHYRLLAVDHPVGTEVYTDERFAIPLPPLKVFTTEEPRLFASAVDHNGRDVSEIVSNIDEEYLDDIKRGQFQGVAEDHFVELELPADAPLDKKIWVIADGWVHPTDASINVQRGQGVPAPPKSLSIEVQAKDGSWKPAKENLGFPAGKMKTALLDLEGVFKDNPESRKIRLRTEMEVFWDKLAWAVDTEGNSNQTHEIDLNSAELRYRGFSVIEKPDDSSPEVPDYSRLMTTGQRWRDLEGYFTRFGDIKELLLKTDDRYVLANAGDEIVMRFPALAPVKEGYKRDFVIIGNGWIKDGDLNSDFSKTVIPLPTQASNDYSRPPTKLEDDPVYQKNKDDWIKFHTRFIAPDRFRNAVRGE